jgi:hypothetical protein
MTDHVFPKGDGGCAVCGVMARDARRVACTDSNARMSVAGEKSLPPR